MLKFGCRAGRRGSVKSTALPNDRLHIEEGLLKKLAAGDEAALSELFHRCRNRVYSIAYKLTRCTATSEEIVQDVFLNLWCSRASLTAVEHPESYLFVITRNVAYKALRRLALKRQTTVLIEDGMLSGDVTDTTPSLVAKELGTLLRTAVERLPPQQQQVYRYIREQGLKREEVADLLQLQPETVKFYLARATRKVRSFCLSRLNTLLSLLPLLLHAGFRS